MNAAEQRRPMPWAQVSQHPDFQKADWQTRQKMRNNYVDRVVRPLAKSEEDFARVRDQFFTATEGDVFGERTRRERTKLGDSDSLNAGYGGGLADQRALDAREPAEESQIPSQGLDMRDPGESEGRTVTGWGANLSRGVVEGALGSVGAAVEGAGLIAEQASAVEANRQVDDALKRLETTKQQYESALDGTTDAYRENVEANFQRQLSDREQELHQAMTDWAEREPNQAAQWLRDRGVDLREAAQSVGPSDEYRGIATDVAGGLGSMLTYMGPGLVAGAITRGSSAAAMGTAVGMAGPSGVSDQFQRAKAAGLDEEAALEKAMQGFAGGAIQVAPLAAMIKPLPAELQGKAIGQLYGLMRAAGSEAIVEGAGGVLQNLIEQSYNPERGTWDDTAYQAAISGGSAGLLQAGVQIATRGRGMNAGAPRHSQPEAEQVDAQQADTDADAEWEAAWREQAAEDGIADFDPNANIPDTTIEVEGQQAEATQAEAPQADSPQVEAAQQQEIQPESTQTALPQEDDAGARLIRSPVEQLSPVEQRARERLLTGDGYAYLRERAEGNDAAVAAVDRMQILATDGDASGAADAYKEARQLLSPAKQKQATQPAPAPEARNEAIEEQLTDASALDQEAVTGAAIPPEPTLAPDQPSPAPERMTPKRVAVADIQVDPDAYQFRSNVNQDGVDSRLEGVEKWDDLRAGNLVLHERLDGSLYAADGHHRINLARQLEQPDVNALVLREADGVTVEDARIEAATANIAAGSATPIDAAKVFRNTDVKPAEAINRFDLPRKSPVVRDGIDIAKLANDAFGAVLNGVVAEKDGATIGRAFSDPDQQMAAIEVFQRVKPTNENQRALLANEVRQAGFAESQGEQGGLFGEDPAESLIGERVRVMDSLRQTLVRDRRLFATLNDNAQTAEKAGNRIAKEQNNALQDASSEAVALLERATTTPEINQQINDAARRVKDGESLASVTRELKEALLNGPDTTATQQSRTPAPGDGSANQAGQDVGGSAGVSGLDDARTAGASQQRVGDDAGQQQGSVTLKADGTPFQTRRAVELSKRFRDTPNATPVEIEGGWGFIEQQSEAVQPVPETLLETQTEESLALREQQTQQAEQAEAQQRIEAEQRAQADRDADDFRLAGSNRQADIATAGGQTDLLATQPTPQAAPAKQRKPATLTPRQQRVSDAFGGAVVGDTINLLTDVGYSKAGNAYTIDSINKDGTLQATSVERGSSVLISQGDWTLATRRTKAPIAEVVSKFGQDDARYSVGSDSNVLLQAPRAADITAALADAPELADTRIIQTTAELPPQALLGMMLRDVNPADVRGMFIGDELYVVADNVSSVEEGVQTAVHEAVGHKGVRGVLGAELEPVMRQVYNSLPLDPRGREALSEVLESYPFLDQSNPEHQVTIAEEMIAHLAEKGWQPNVLRRAVAKIRELLRRHFPSIGWTDTDVMQLAKRSREYLRRQQQASEGVAEPEIGFSLNSQGESASTSAVQSGLSEVSGIGRPKILESADNLALDIALESTIAGVNPQEAIAFYHGDDLYVIAGNASDTAEAVRATVSTVVGNKGLRATLGNRVDATLLNVVAGAQKSIVGRDTLRGIYAEYDHLSIDHTPDQVNLGAELVARMSELSDPPAFIQEANTKLDGLLQSGYPNAGFASGDGHAMARQNRHHLQQQQRDFGEGKPPYSLPYVFSAQDGPGRGTLLDMNTQVVDANGDIVSDARIDGPVKSAAKYGQGFFESATDRLRRSNSPVLQELAKRVDAYFDQAEARLGMVNGILREPLKRLRTLNPFERSRNMRDFESYMRHRDNGRDAEAQSVADSNAAVAELAEAVDTMFDQVGTINQTVKTPQGTGMRVFDSKTGAYRKIGKFKKGGFWPRAIRPEVQRVMHDPTSNTKLWHELLDALIDDGHANTRKEAAEYLRGNSGYFSSEITSDYFAGIEKARGEKLPEMFYDYRFDVVSNYARKWSDRISQVEQFGQKIGPMGKDAFEEAASVARDQRTKEYIGWLADRAYNRRPTDAYHELMAIANLVATGLQLGNPGTATLNIIGGTQLNVQMFGSKRMAKAYLDLAMDAKNIYREGVELGILGKDVLNILRDADNRNANYMDANSKTKEWLGKFSAGTMKWGGYTGTEQIIRATGMIAARAQLMDALHAWNKRPHSRDSRTYRKFMERNRIDVAKLLRENGKGEETARYLRLMVNIPQGSYRVDQTPVYVDTPMGRFFFKYQKFGTQVSRLFWQQKVKPMMDAWADPKASAADKAQFVMPVLQWFGWAVLGGGAVLAARGAMFGYMDPGPELDELIKAVGDDGFIPSLGFMASKAHANLIAGSAYGFFGNYIQMAKDVADQQRVKNPFEPPGLAPVDSIIELVRRGLEQGRFPYAEDFDQVINRNFSLYRTSKRGLAALGSQAGFDADFVQLEQARRDLQYIRKAARRFANESGIDATRTATGRFGLTENTAENREIVNAITIGDGRRAAALVDAALDATQTREEELRRKQSIRSVVRARHPVQLGGPASQEEIDLFLDWVDDRLPRSKAQFVKDMIEQYDDATWRAGL